MKVGKRCGGTPSQPKKCCQAITQSGKKCSRLATINFDLTKQRKILGVNIPLVKCCFLCYQHMAIISTLAARDLAQKMIELDLTYDDYYTIHPDRLKKDIKI